MAEAQDRPSPFTATEFAAHMAEMLTASPKGKHWVATLGLREHPSTFTITTASGQRFRVAVDECREAVRQPEHADTRGAVPGIPGPR